MLTERHIEALTVAILAVGMWPADKVRVQLPRFRAAGLLSPAQVAGMDLGEITVKLAKNGYGRGLLTSMYAERLQALMREAAAGALDNLPALIVAGDKKEFTTLLRKIHGVGPRVTEHAWALLQANGEP